jgi:hypothetical protein
MYNLTVAIAHTFFVGEEQWLVHNAKCDGFNNWWQYTIRKYRKVDVNMLIPNDGRYGIRGDDNVVNKVIEDSDSVSYHYRYFIDNGKFDDSVEEIVVFDTLNELGGYLIQNGHNRWKAAQKLIQDGKTKFPKLKVVILPKPEGFKNPN